MSFDWVVAAFALIAAFFFFIWRGNRRREARHEQRIIDNQALHSERKRKAAAEALWLANRQEAGWQFVTPGSLMKIPQQPVCYIMVSKDGKTLCFEKRDGEFNIEADPFLVVQMANIASLDIVRPSTTLYRSVDVPDTITNVKRKSPVKRGLVGLAVLGPAGAVIGAASGLKDDVSIQTTTKRVTESYQGEGNPRLAIGTNDPANPYFEIRFLDSTQCDIWLHRIRVLRENATGNIAR